MMDLAKMAPSLDRHWLLVTDVDDTLLGDDEAYESFVRVVEASPSLRVVLNSSRPVASVRRTLDSLSAPIKPDAIIGAMGTQVWHDGALQQAWTTRFEPWSREPVDQVMSKLGFKPHDDEFQTPLKASFAVPGPEAQRAAADALHATGQPMKIVASGKSDFDVLPPSADKGDATLFACELLHIATDRLIVAGDSGNDIAMFKVARKGIVVGNARDELREAVDASTVFFARRAQAGGLLEGLIHFEVPVTLDATPTPLS